MTRDRDIERVLDHWFAEGPSVIPDRVMVHALQRVDRTPQRRLAALLSRYRPMPASIRLGLAAAAVVAVVVAGMTFFKPGPGPGTSPSPTPSPAPSATAANLPNAILGRWMGGPRLVAGLSQDGGTSLTFTLDSLTLSPSNDDDIDRLGASAAASDVDRVEVESTSETDGCPVGETGVYTWSVSAGGRILTLVMESDDCAVRGAALAGTWWKMECPILDDNCLGDLEPGRYASQFIDPFLPSSAGWEPRYAALTYEVPAGWANTADWPQNFTLARQGAADGTYIFLYTDVVVVSEEDPCSETPDPNVGRTAQEIVDWLASAPGLITSEPLPVTIGGLSGARIDVEMDPAWTTTCSFSEGQPVRGLFTDATAGGGFAWNVGQEGRMRLFLLDVGGGRALMVDIEGTTQAEYEAIVDEATTIVESFEFNP